MSENTRYGVYLVLTSAAFVAMLVPAIRSAALSRWRFWRDPMRSRISIVAFTTAQAVFWMISGANRIRAPLGSPLPVGIWAELIRVACCVTAWGIVFEYIVLRSRTPWDGKERRNGHDRRHGWGPKG